MKSLINFLLHVLLGVDMIIGLWGYLFTVVVLQLEPGWWILFASVVFAHLPDLDMIPYFILKRMFGVRFRLASHRVIGHHPLILIPLVVTCIAVIAPPGLVMQWSLLALIGIMGHFIHDSFGPHGFHWLSPFSWERITMSRGLPVRVPRREWI